MCLIIDGVDANGNRFRAFQCGCGIIDPDERIGKMMEEMYEAEYRHHIQDIEDWENFKRHEPNRFEFKIKSKHIQLGHRVNRIPATAQRL